MVLGLITDEFDILPACESVCNKCPVIHVEHKVALEDWCVKHVYIYAYSNFFKWRQSSYKIDHDTLLSWTSAILLINPEIVTAWNARKELLCQNVQLPIEELKFSEVVLSRKPKSSQVFSHRKWVLLKLQNSKMQPCSFQEIIEYELALCTRIAERYPNNYYAWTHRIWIVQEMLNVCLKIVSEELLRMEHWVSTHISDYSGFHYRQFLLSCSSNTNHLNAKQLQNYITCPIHMNVAKDCDCIKCRSCHADDKGDWNIFCYHKVLERELTLLTELQTLFPGHEALWNHRRFVVYECSKVYSSPGTCPIKCISLESANAEIAIQCKRYKRDFSCDTLDWNSVKEKDFIVRLLRRVDNNKWERKLVLKHVTWLKNVLSWSYSDLDIS